MGKNQTTLREQVDKKYQGFADEVESLSITQLEARISSYQKQLDESEEHKEANELLKHAQEKVSELNGPYNDIRNAVKLKTKFIIHLIKEKGGQ